MSLLHFALCIVALLVTLALSLFYVFKSAPTTVQMNANTFRALYWLIVFAMYWASCWIGIAL